MSPFTGGLARAMATMTGQEREALVAHLRAGTSANWLSDVLKRNGFDISPTTIKEQRAKVRNE